jgi:general stress protein YciG
MAAKQRGFAAMDQEKQREIARRGGQAAHQRGTAHEFTAEEAAAAGRKGGQAVSRNREHMARIGRKGGLATHHRGSASASSAPQAGMPIAPSQHAQGSARREQAAMDNKMPEERQASAQSPEQKAPVSIQPLHAPPADARRDEGDWESEQLLEEGRMGNENASTERDLQPAVGGRFEEHAPGPREGGHGYGSFEEEGSPEASRTGPEGSGDRGQRRGRNNP